MSRYAELLKASKWASLVIVMLLGFMRLASAVPITGVTATTNMGNGFGSNISHIVDGSGLSSYSTSASHSAGTISNAWAGNSVVTGVVVFNLGGLFAIDGMAVWNFNSASSTAGVKDLTIEGSVNGATYFPIVGSPTQFAQGADNASETAQLFSFATAAEFLRFNIASNYGFTTSGLSEVIFTGARVAAVPEPVSLALLGIAFAAFGATRRRKNT